MSDDLEKGLKERLLAAGLAVAMPKPAQAPEMPKAHIQHVQKAPKLATEAPKPTKPKEVKVTFDPSTLSQELHPIAHIESSFGRNMNHQHNSKGNFDTAVGAVGLKPVTAFETYQKSKSLQKLFPNLHDKDKFLERFQGDSQFYNSMASAVWNHMKRSVNSIPAKTAYAWRHGLGASLHTPDEKINTDPYVKQFLKLSSGKMEPHRPSNNAVPMSTLKSEQMNQMIEALKKNEKENKLKIAQAAFKTTDGKVCPCGPIHDPSCLPEGSVIEEEGFVLRDGTFVNRTEATKLLHTDHPIQSQEIDMEKAMPSPNLPKLGVENRRETPIVTPQQAKVKTRIDG